MINRPVLIFVAKVISFLAFEKTLCVIWRIDTASCAWTKPPIQVDILEFNMFSLSDRSADVMTKNQLDMTCVSCLFWLSN